MWQEDMWTVSREYRAARRLCCSLAGVFQSERSPLQRDLSPRQVSTSGAGLQNKTPPVPPRVRSVLNLQQQTMVKYGSIKEEIDLNRPTAAWCKETKRITWLQYIHFQCIRCAMQQLLSTDYTKFVIWHSADYFTCIYKLAITLHKASH